MEENENELLLFDRTEIIKTFINQWGEENIYLSFSGGKDSTILHYLLDMASPNNRIPRVFINTGIEYQAIVKFVKELQSKDDRFVILKPTKSLKDVGETYGFPFKSKEHSHHLSVYQHSGLGKTVKKYLGIEKGNRSILCPKALKYQFEPDYKIKTSEKCCLVMKKRPAKKWEKENGRHISITGMRIEEGGQRLSIQCVVYDKDRKAKKFHPLSKVDDNWENWFVRKYKIKLCELYYPPYNFRRTGCAGCPFSLDLQKQLNKMEQYLPIEKKLCEQRWKVVYDEYRRIGYRLKKSGDQEQLLLELDDNEYE